MQDAIKLLMNYGLTEEQAGKVAYDVAQAMTDMWELEDVETVAEEMGVELTEARKREVLAWWRTLDSYGELDREGIEWAIKQTINKV